MQDFMELCEKRQSCRDFSDKPVEREKLSRCVEAARLAPSACNSQPWRFIVVKTPEIVRQVAKCGQPQGSNAFLDKAQAFVLILEEHARLMPRLRAMIDSQYFAKADLGAAAAYICLEAEQLGLGTCVIGLFDREGICQACGLPENTAIGQLIAVGYPASAEVRAKTRKPLEEILRFV